MPQFDPNTARAVSGGFNPNTARALNEDNQSNFGMSTPLFQTDTSLLPAGFLNRQRTSGVADLLTNKQRYEPTDTTVQPSSIQTMQGSINPETDNSPNMWNAFVGGLKAPFQQIGQESQQAAVENAQGKGALNDLLNRGKLALDVIMSPISAVLGGTTEALGSTGQVGKTIATGANNIFNLPFEAVKSISSFTGLGSDAEKIAKEMGMTPEETKKAGDLIQNLAGLYLYGKLGEGVKGVLNKTDAGLPEIKKAPEQLVNERVNEVLNPEIPKEETNIPTVQQITEPTKTTIPQGKQPYEMTKDEMLSKIFNKNYGKGKDGLYYPKKNGVVDDINYRGRDALDFRNRFERDISRHKNTIEQALKEGKQVPQEVLKDYPDLADKYKATKPEQPQVNPEQVNPQTGFTENVLQNIESRTPKESVQNIDLNNIKTEEQLKQEFIKQKNITKAKFDKLPLNDKSGLNQEFRNYVNDYKKSVQDELVRKSNEGKEQSRLETEKLNKQFEQDAINAESQMPIDERIQSKIDRGAKLTPEENQYFQENQYAPKGFKYDVEGNLQKIRGQQNLFNPEGTKIEPNETQKLLNDVSGTNLYGTVIPLTLNPKEIKETAKANYDALKQTGAKMGEFASEKIGEKVQSTRRVLVGIKRSLSESPQDVQQAKDIMYKHHQLIRDAAFVGRKLKIDFEKMVGEQKDSRGNVTVEPITPERKTLMMDAFEQPEKYYNQLTTREKEIVDTFRDKANTIQKYVENTGIFDKSTLGKNPNYIFHWWEDKKTGEPYAPIYGQFSKGAPQLKERVIPTYEQGRSAGLKPATDNLGELMGYSLQGITRAAETRNMFKSLAQLEADGEGMMKRSSRSSQAKPLRVLESWGQLVKQHQTDGYIRYDHPALDKTMVFKNKDGNTVMLKGAVGIKQELYPFVKAYFESPNYGSVSKWMFGFKTLKLMGGFHIFSLNFQSLAGSPGVAKIPIYNVINGLKEIKGMGDDLRLLYRNGLELHGYADTGNYQSILEGKGLLRRTLRASSDFTFNVVHPGIKAFTATHVFDDLNTKLENKLNRPLTPEEKNINAKKAVNYTDRLFSGEDKKAQVLQTNEWMAKNWYSPEAAKKWQMTLLSPTWQKEHLGMLKDVIKSISVDIKKPESYLYRRYLYGALSIYGISNLYNYYMTAHMDGKGKFMWENPNAFTVRVPWNKANGEAEYMHPLKSIFEIPELLSDPIGKAINKLSPPIRTVADAYKDIREKKPKLTVAINAAENLTLPISGSMIGKSNEPWQSQVSSVIGSPVYGAPKQSNLEKAGLEDSKEIKSIKTQEKKVEELKKKILEGESGSSEYRKEYSKLKYMKVKSRDWGKYQRFLKKQQREINQKLYKSK